MKDIDSSLSGTIPGEWVLIVDAKLQVKYLAFVNLHTEIFFKIKIMKQLQWNSEVGLSESQIALELLTKVIISTLKRKESFKDYLSGCRLIFGDSDSIPGLIVDKYQKYILIQINTAGVDRFRIQIKNLLQEKFINHKVVLFDNNEYRKAENLPIYEKELITEDLEILENSILYNVPQKILQKIGYYYDHRENRLKLLKLIERMDIPKENGLDLFSYIGSWGLHLLKAGVAFVDFVDQGDMSFAVLKNLALNGEEEKGKFVRSDVFKFLDLALKENKKYNIIVSDPPAFTKSEKNKPMAILGYEKLHTKALRIISDRGLFVAASCTHYVTHEELDKTVKDAAFKNDIEVQLLDIGIQGFDHTMSGLKDKSFYIKYLVYFVKRGES